MVRSLAAAPRRRPRRLALPLLALAVALGALAAPARPALAGGFVEVRTHLAALSAMVDRSLIETAFGYGARGGWRWGRWGVFLAVEHDLWVTTEHDRDVVHGVLDVGLGGEVSYFEGRARTSLSAGPSVLLFDTFLDDAGTTGFHVHLQPIGLRWDLGAGWGLALDPLSLAVVVPVTGSIPLVKVEYRTTVGLELSL